jgi:hypothetical protein
VQRPFLDAADERGCGSFWPTLGDSVSGCGTVHRLTIASRGDLHTEELRREYDEMMARATVFDPIA